MEEIIEAYCVYLCGRKAVSEELLALDRDGNEIVDLVCYEHKTGLE